MGMIEDDKEKPIEEVKPKTRVEFEAYAKRLSAMIVANSVRTMLFFLSQVLNAFYRKA